jgi:DNA-directed RNA polymerase subunit RPC12/RpoP
MSDETSSAPPSPPVDDRDRLGRASATGDLTDEGKGRVFPCEECGADLEFNIGSQTLKCPYCGHQKSLNLDADAKIEEQDLDSMLQRMKDRREQDQSDEEGTKEVRCQSCGGNVEFVGTLTSTACPYCGSPIQRENVHTATKRIPVDGVLPFFIERERAHQQFREWVGSRWFAPTAFVQQGAEGKFNGVYVPYWTFDTLTFNVYSGQRGDAYWVTVGSGKDERRERRVRWSFASGNFQRFFDDVTVLAARGLNHNLVNALDPWPFPRMIPFTQEVLAGFLARTYDVPLPDGFTEARNRIDSLIEQDVRHRIGGDEQQISDIKSRYDAITFKHLLLPIWMLAYQYQGKAFRVYVNGATGAIQGERPWSWVKISLTVLLAVAVVVIIAALKSR